MKNGLEEDVGGKRVNIVRFLWEVAGEPGIRVEMERSG
jgi:hypothetical protein